MTERKSHLDTLAVASLVGCCFLWGLNQVAAKAAMPEVPPLWQAAARSLGGAGLVAMWARLRGIRIFTRDATLPGGLLAGALFAAEFVSGFGVMMLDISIGAIFAAVIPDRLRSRVTGAFQAVNYGTRPLGALLGGLLGSVLGLRPALWVATIGGMAGFVLLLPTPVPRYRLPAVDGPARA